MVFEASECKATSSASAFSAGLLIQAAPGVARIFGSVLEANRSGCFALAAAKGDVPLSGVIPGLSPMR